MHLHSHQYIYIYIYIYIYKEREREREREKVREKESNISGGIGTILFHNWCLEFKDDRRLNYTYIMWMAQAIIFYLVFLLIFSKILKINALIVFQSDVSRRNSIHFKHHCLCQSRKSFQKRTLTEQLWVFLFSRYFNQKSVHRYSSNNFFSITKSWWGLNKTETS